MPIYTVKMPTGEVYDVEGPENASQADLYTEARKYLAGQRKKAGEMALEGTGPLDRFMIGAGAQITDIGRGVGQWLGKVSHEDVQEARERDAPISETGAGMAGRFAGGVAATLPALAVPGANTIAGSAAVGAGLGALSPRASSDEAIYNTVMGGLFGGGGALAGKALGRVVSPIRSRLTPEAERLAAGARAEGIPLDLAQRTGSKPLQTWNSVAEYLPSTASREAAKRQAQQGAFTSAALRRAGVVGDSAEPAVLAGRSGELGRQLDRIYSRTKMPVHGGLAFDLRKIATDAEKKLGAQNATAIRSYVESLIDETAQLSPKAFKLPGPRVQSYRQELRQFARGGGNDALFWGKLRDRLTNEFKQALKPKDARKYERINREFANLNIIEDAMGGGGVGPKMGQLAPAQLSRALTSDVGKKAFARGYGDLNNLSRIGNVFVRDSSAQSPTAQRMLYQTLATAAPGYAYGLLTGEDPISALQHAAVAGAGGLLMPRAIQGALNNPRVQQYLMEGLLGGARQLPAAVNPALTAGAINLPTLMNR